MLGHLSKGWLEGGWLALPDTEIRSFSPGTDHPVIKVLCVQDKDEPITAMRSLIAEECRDAVVIYVDRLVFRSFLDGDKQIKQAYTYVAPFGTWRDAVDALERGLKASDRTERTG